MTYDRNPITNLRPQALASRRPTSIEYVESPTSGYPALGAPSDASTWNPIFTTEFLSEVI